MSECRFDRLALMEPSSARTNRQGRNQVSRVGEEKALPLVSGRKGRWLAPSSGLLNFNLNRQNGDLQFHLKIHTIQIVSIYAAAFGPAEGMSWQLKIQHLAKLAGSPE